MSRTSLPPVRKGEYSESRGSCISYLLLSEVMSQTRALRQHALVVVQFPWARGLHTTKLDPPLRAQTYQHGRVLELRV